MVPPTGWIEPGPGAAQAFVPEAVRLDGAEAFKEGDDVSSWGSDGDEEAPPLLSGDEEEARPNHNTADNIAPIGLPHDGIERGSLASAALLVVVEPGSVSSRIADFYASMPAADAGVPCVDPVRADRPRLLDKPALQLLLRFIVSRGGGGLCKADQVILAQVLLALEPADLEEQDENKLRRRLAPANALATAVRHEEERIMAGRAWMRVIMSFEANLCNYYYRDILDCVVDVVRAAGEL